MNLNILAQFYRHINVCVGQLWFHAAFKIQLDTIDQSFTRIYTSFNKVLSFNYDVLLEQNRAFFAKHSEYVYTSYLM